ncbi:hypothetical protein JCM10213_006147 [Rhodosporidiobolus nylandii]
MPAALGPCVVCGQETKSRCGPCVKAGLEGVFFCSPEHQRLLWPVHKKVCGSNPFRLPLLTNEEAQYAKDHLATMIHTSNGEGGVCLLEAIGGGAPALMVKGIIDAITEGAAKKYPDPAPFLACIRTFRWLLTHQRGSPSAAAFDSLAGLEYGITTRHPDPNIRDELEAGRGWVSSLRHAALPFFATIELQGAPTPPSTKHIWHTYQALLRYIEVDLGTTKGEAMAKVVKAALDEVAKVEKPAIQA